MSLSLGAQPQATLRTRFRYSFFADRSSSIVSLAFAAVSILVLASLAKWGVLDAAFAPNLPSCRAAHGARWGVIAEKYRLVLFGRYPFEQQWRPALASLILIASVTAAISPRLFGRVGLSLFAIGLIAFCAIMAGGLVGMSATPTDLWGGLPLTMFLSVVACAAGAPLGFALALGRRSQLPLLSWLSAGYIEFVRGIPLITLLFFGAFVMPLLLPGWRLDPMIRVAFCLVMFAAAYLAEVFRGGLQSIPKGQFEAAKALSLTRWQALTRVTLPQALRLTIAPTASTLIGAIKDTSLIAIVNLYDITGALKLAISDPDWRPYFVEMYIVVSLAYLTIGVSISLYGRFLERRYAVK